MSELKVFDRRVGVKGEPGSGYKMQVFWRLNSNYKPSDKVIATITVAKDPIPDQESSPDGHASVRELPVVDGKAILDIFATNFGRFLVTIIVKNKKGEIVSDPEDCILEFVEEYSRDIMIVPNEDAGKTSPIFNHNYLFSQQWKTENFKERGIVTVPVTDNPGYFIGAMQLAAKRARRGFGCDHEINSHKIILFIGHGSERDDAPKDKKDKKVASFDTVPETGKYETHKHKITADVLTLGVAMDEGQIEVRNNPQNGEPEFYRGNIKMMKETGHDYDDRMEIKYAKLLKLRKVSKYLVENNIKQLIILTCNVGTDEEFAPNLAKILKIPVGVYRHKVITDFEFLKSKKLIQLWLAPSKAESEAYRPKEGDAGFENSFHEIPPVEANGIP